jgi:hypothetical protein
VWAETPEGRRQPFDREPDPEKGNRVLLGRGPLRAPLALPPTMLSMAVPHTPSAKKLALGWIRGTGVAYVPHHATCPEVERFRSGPRTEASAGASGSPPGE